MAVEENNLFSACAAPCQVYSSRFYKVQKNIAFKIDIIFANLLIQTQMQQQHSGRITHAQERYRTKIPR